MLPTLRWIAAGLAFASAGCDRLFTKGAKEDIAAAEQKARANDAAGARQLYERALDGSPDSAEVHYRLALLYADKLKSPLDALHHFGRCLELAPNGPHAKEAREYKKEGEHRLLLQLAKGNPVSQEEAARLKNDNLALRKTLAEVRAQKSATPVPLPPGMKKGEDPRKPIPPNARTHTVEPGETLAKISLKYYKSKNRWKDIQDANFYTMEGTPTIKPGTVLIIP